MNCQIYTLTAQAEADLDTIWLDIATDNPPAADRMIDNLLAKARYLAEFPHAGRAREDLGRDLRAVPVGSYILVYTPTVKGIVVVRFLHGMRDLPELF